MIVARKVKKQVSRAFMILLRLSVTAKTCRDHLQDALLSTLGKAIPATISAAVADSEARACAWPRGITLPAGP